MPGITPEGRPGFQGSETTSVRATIYSHSNDPVVLSPSGGKIEIKGRYAHDEFPSLVMANTNKSMGAASGTFALALKPSQRVESLFDRLVDDDWVDIVFYRHDQPWHVMRGLIDEIRRVKTVAGSGATSTTFNITGRDFGKIWEITPVWFSPYANSDLVTKAVAHKVFGALPEVVGSPAVAVEAYLKGFLESLSSEAGVDWTPPPEMPGMEAGNFLDNVFFFTAGYQNVPARKAFNPNFMAPQGTLWSLAQQNSDPLFTELYADLLPAPGDPFSNLIESGNPLAPEDTRMTVVIRDKPFPVTIDSEDPASGADGFESWWTDLPVHVVPRQQIVPSDLGRSGLERFNAYFVASLLHTEAAGEHALSILAPLINPEEVKRHGMRRMDVQSSMAPDETNLDFGKMVDLQRRIVRDWYCLNPYLLSGTLNLGIGRPDIKIGCRVRVPGAVSETEDESYYVEQVSHNWVFGPGTKTSLGVTRGWIGSDDSYLRKLTEVMQAYSVPKLRRDS